MSTSKQRARARGRSARSPRAAGARRSRSRRERSRPTLRAGVAASAAATASGSIVSPHGGVDQVHERRRWRSAMSAIRAPNAPATQTIASSPGSVRLATQASMPALPVPGTASVSWFAVRKTCCRRPRVSSMIAQVLRIEVARASAPPAPPARARGRRSVPGRARRARRDASQVRDPGLTRGQWIRTPCRTSSACSRPMSSVAQARRRP